MFSTKVRHQLNTCPEQMKLQNTLNWIEIHFVVLPGIFKIISNFLSESKDFAYLMIDLILILSEK